MKFTPDTIYIAYTFFSFLLFCIWANRPLFWVISLFMYALGIYLLFNKYFGEHE